MISGRLALLSVSSARLTESGDGICAGEQLRRPRACDCAVGERAALLSAGREGLVVWGRDDPGAIYESAVAAVKRMPRARMMSFSQCGHKPMLEHTTSFNALVRDFVKNG